MRGLMMRRVLVTGASGFVGRILCEALVGRNMRVRAAVHKTRLDFGNTVEVCEVGEVGSRTDWSRALEGVD